MVSGGEQGDFSRSPRLSQFGAATNDYFDFD